MSISPPQNRKGDHNGFKARCRPSHLIAAVVQMQQQTELAYWHSS